MSAAIARPHHTVSLLGAQALKQQLAGSGVRIRTGPLVCCIRSGLAVVGQAVARLYADHPLAGPHSFADFHVELRRAAGVRGWVKPQVEFVFDGQRPFKPLPLPQAFAMLEWGLNWCVAAHSHQYLIVHAASLEKGGRALVLPAPPGSGKSTLCAALMLSGWRLLSDELTLIDINTGLLHPLARPVNLKNESIDIIAQTFPEAIFGPRVPDTQKGCISHLKPTRQSIDATHLPARARWIVFPRYQRDACAALTPMGQARSFMAVAENAFNYGTLGVRGFQVVGDLIDSTQSMSMVFGHLDQALEMIDTLCP